MSQKNEALFFVLWYADSHLCLHIGLFTANPAHRAHGGKTGHLVIAGIFAKAGAQEQIIVTEYVPTSNKTSVTAAVLKTCINAASIAAILSGGKTGKLSNDITVV